jgi:endo-1,4-beta-xylanase
MKCNTPGPALTGFALAALCMSGLLTGCASHQRGNHAQIALKDAFKKDFLVGVAINQAQFSGQDARGEAIIKSQFNSITPENVLKWESVHPEPDRYNFEPADRYVEFGEKNGMNIIGHCLVWHNQTPKWVFEDANGNPVDRETLLARMRDHIHTVVGRYKGRIKAWDVVNEAIFDDGSWRQTPWFKIIGEDFIAKAFQFAHEADPAADLTYNEYQIEDEPKRKGMMAMIRKLQAQGVPITAIGTQMHERMDWPSIDAVDAHFRDLCSLGLKVWVTELDVQVLPDARPWRNMNLTTNAPLRAQLDLYPNGLPASVQRAFAERYAELFRAILNYADKIDRVTFWGVSDADTWLDYWPVAPRTDYPLLFDRNGKPKAAFDAVIRAGLCQTVDGGLQ